MLKCYMLVVVSRSYKVESPTMFELGIVPTLRKGDICHIFNEWRVKDCQKEIHSCSEACIIGFSYYLVYFPELYLYISVFGCRYMAMFLVYLV